MFTTETGLVLMRCRFILANPDEPRLNSRAAAGSDFIQDGNQHENFQSLVSRTLPCRSRRSLGCGACRRASGQYESKPHRTIEFGGYPAEHRFALRSARSGQLRFLLGILPGRPGSHLQAGTGRQQRCRRLLHHRTVLHLQISVRLICGTRPALR